MSFEEAVTMNRVNNNYDDDYNNYIDDITEGNISGELYRYI